MRKRGKTPAFTHLNSLGCLLEHFALSGKSPSDDFYTLRLPFGDAAIMAQEIVQNVKEIGWNTPAQQRALLMWFVEAYKLDVEIVGLSA